MRQIRSYPEFPFIPYPNEKADPTIVESAGQACLVQAMVLLLLLE